MPLISSPVGYPLSSPPPQVVEKRKRSHHPDTSSESKRRLVSVGDGASKGHPGLRMFPVDSPRLGPEDAEGGHVKVSRPRGPFLDDNDNVEDVMNGDEAVTEPWAPLMDDDSIAVGDGDTLDVFDRGATMKDRVPDVECGWAGVPRVKTSSGKIFEVHVKETESPVTYEQLIAVRSTTTPGEATRSSYGIEIHNLLVQAAKEPKLVQKKPVSDNEAPLPLAENPTASKAFRNGRTMLWTEKYRARKFTDLVGDERTHRDVLRWLKGWDPVVFPSTNKLKLKNKFMENGAEPQQHRKILLLTGPPGLGKTTLAHVCARQAGYEVVEINASDERSRDVVRGRIRDCVGTENVKGINTKDGRGTTRKSGRPVCVIVDEVDGVVSGSGGGGEGGFIKALLDLAMLNQKNLNVLGATSANAVKLKKKGDSFRLLRPIILICNDVYHPALRPLRSSAMAEIVHIRRPPLDKVVARLKSVFDREGVACDSDGVRRLCEATWGIGNRGESRNNSSGTGEGDIRGVLVVGEWVAAKMRASNEMGSRLTKKWVEEHMIENLSHGGGGARGLGRGGSKRTVERVFLDGAGFPKAVSAPPADDLGNAQNGDAIGDSGLAKRAALDQLREMVDTNGESDRIMTDCFTAYPLYSWQDDTFLSKPNAAYEWLHFHDRVSSKVHVGQEWELGPYLSQSVLGFHHLFASPAKQSWISEQKRSDEDEEEPLPFSGPRADYSAAEALKQNKAILQGLQSSLSTPLCRSFKSIEDISTELLPHLIKMLTPDVKPIVVGGSGDQRGMVSVRKDGEREMIQHSVAVMSAVGVTFERARVESSQNGFSSYIYRMEPPLDNLAAFETASPSGPTAPARYAIRQALDQEYQKHLLRENADARHARYKAGGGVGPDSDLGHDTKENREAKGEPTMSKLVVAKRDFFGRIIDEARPASKDGSAMIQQEPRLEEKDKDEDNKVWVSFHEGFSNAVRKPITLEELMQGF